MIVREENILDKAPLAVRVGLPAMCMIVVAAFLGISLDPFSPIKLIALKLFVIAGLLTWLHICIVKRRISIVRTPADIPIAMMGLWMCASGFWALNAPLWLEQATLYACGAGLFYLVIFYYRTTESAYRLIAYLLLPVPIVALFGAADLLNKQVFPWDMLLINKLINVFAMLGVEGQAPLGWTDHFNGRISASFGNPVYLAGWTVIILPLAIVMIIEGRTRAMKVFAAVSVVLLSFMTATAFTRSSWISCAASLILLFALLIKKQGLIDKKQLLWVLATLSISVIIPLFMYFSKGRFNTTRYTIEERIESISSPNDPSMMERELIWRTAVDMAIDRPLIGFGAGNFETMQPLYLVKYFNDKKWAKYACFPDRVHNEYLDILVETGIVGLALFIWLIFTFAKAGIAAIERGGTISVLGAGLISGSAGLLVYSCAQFPLHVPAIGMCAWIFAALIIVLGHGDTLRETQLNMGENSKPPRPLLSAAALLLLFIALAESLFQPLLGQIAFQWGVYEKRPGHIFEAMKLMKMAIDTHPGDNEMSARFCMAANNGANDEKNSETRKAILEMSAQEAVRGLLYNPNDSRLYLLAGLAQIKLDNPAAAIKMLEKAVVLNPLEPVAFYNLGIAQYMYARYNYAVDDKEVSQKRFYRSLAHFKKAMELAPGLPGLYSNTGQTLYQLGRYREALKYFRIVEKVEGKSKEIFNYQAMCLAKLGRKRQAASAYRQALAIDPGYSSAAGNLGITLIELGDIDQAIKDLTALLAAEPENGLARYHMGRALHLAYRDAEAVAELKKAEKLMPNSKQPRELINRILGGYESR